MHKSKNHLNIHSSNLAINLILLVPSTSLSSPSTCFFLLAKSIYSKLNGIQNAKQNENNTRDLLATTMGTHVSLLPSFLVVNYFTHNFRVCMASSAHLPAPHPQIRLPSEDIPHEAQHDPTEGPRDEGDGEAQPSGDRIPVEEIALNFRLQKASTAIWIFFVCYWLEVLSIGNLRNLCFFGIYLYIHIFWSEKASTFCWWFNSWPFWDGETWPTQRSGIKRSRIESPGFVVFFC